MEAETARRLAEIEEAIARAEAEASILEAEARAADAEARAAEAEGRAADAEARVAEAERRAAEAEAVLAEAEALMRQRERIAQDAIDRAERMATDIVRDPSLRTAFHRRSWTRTGIGIGLAVGGAMLALQVPCSASGYWSSPDGSYYLVTRDHELKPTLPWETCKVGGFVMDAFDSHTEGLLYTWTIDQPDQFLRDRNFLSEDERRELIGVYFDTEAKTRIAIGLGMLAVGGLLATVWSDVPGVQLVAVSASPDGVRVSRSFGW